MKEAEYDDVGMPSHLLGEFQLAQGRFTEFLGRRFCLDGTWYLPGGYDLYAESMQN